MADNNKTPSSTKKKNYTPKQQKAINDSIRAIKQFYGDQATPEVINSILGNIEVETGFRSLKEGQYSWKNLQENPNLKTVRKKLEEWGGTQEDYEKLSHDEKLSVMYWGDKDHTATAGGRGSIQLTSAGYGGNEKTDEDLRAAAEELGMDIKDVHSDFYNSTLATLQVFKNRGQDFIDYAESPMKLRQEVINPNEVLNPEDEHDATKLNALQYYDTDKSYFNNLESKGAVSINPEIIENNPNLNDAAKEEALKVNESQGLEQSTAKAISQPKSLFAQDESVPGYNGATDLNAMLMTDDQLQKKNKVEQERQNALQYTGDTGSFDKDYGILGVDEKLAKGGLLTEYNAGGSHEENKLGGIPVGPNDRGGMNLVEQGETRNNDYIYSNDYKLSEEDAERFGLNMKYVGDSFSDISRDINEETKIRPYDQIVKRTAKGNLDKLMMAQERVKSKDPENSEAAINKKISEGLQRHEAQYGPNANANIQSDIPLPQNDHHMFGGMMNGVMNGAAQSGLAGAGQAGAAGAMGQVAQGGQGATGMLSKMGGAGGVMGDAMMLGKFANNAFGKTGIETNGTTGRQDKVKGAGWDAAGAGMEGMMAGAKYGPIGMAAGAVLGAGSSLLGSEKKRNDIAEANRNASLIENNKFQTTFAKGGSLLNAYLNSTDPNKKKKLNQKDVDSINKSRGANGAVFTNQGANNLFEKVPLDANGKPVIDFGKYGPENYFNVGNMEGDTIRIANTANNPHNRSTINQNLDYLREINPGKNIELDYNSSFHSGGNIKPHSHPHPPGQISDGPPMIDQDPNAYLYQNGPGYSGSINYGLRTPNFNPANYGIDPMYLSPTVRDVRTANERPQYRKPDARLGLAGNSEWDAMGDLQTSPAGDQVYANFRAEVARGRANLAAKEAKAREAQQSMNPGATPDPAAGFSEYTTLDDYVDTKAIDQHFNPTTPLSEYEADAAEQDRMDNMADEQSFVNGLPTYASNIDNDLIGIPEDNVTDSSVNEDTGQRGFQPQEILKYAPTIGNALQLMNMPDAEVERYDRLDARYRPQQVDERTLENRVANSAANTRRSLANYAGGSQAAARANLLGSQINESRALSEAMASAQEANRQDNRVGQQFNLGIDQANQQIGQAETIANAQNRGARQTRKDLLMQNMFNNLGDIGMQESNSRIHYNVSGGYNTYGQKDTMSATDRVEDVYNRASNVLKNKKNKKGGLLDVAKQLFPR